MLQPQSTALFVLLIAVFGALMWRTLTARRAIFRVLAACLAFLPAMVFGVLAVNKYYDYYQSWGAVISDLTHQGIDAASHVPGIKFASDSKSGTLDGSGAELRLAQQQGYTLRMLVTGQRSHITRQVYVYLPPQYFQAAYRAYRFPVLELIHGQPGQPQDWITVVGVTHAFDHLLAEKLAQPAVLLMPDANGGRNISLQCLNQVGGPQDLTYLAVDLPAQITHILRVLPPGMAWGVAGLLRRRVLRRQHGPALPQPLRVRRGAQRLLRAVRQPARRDEPPHQPVRRQHQPARTEHAAGRDPGAARHRGHPPLLARSRRG